MFFSVKLHCCWGDNKTSTQNMNVEKLVVLFNYATVSVLIMPLQYKVTTARKQKIFISFLCLFAAKPTRRPPPPKKSLTHSLSSSS